MRFRWVRRHDAPREEILAKVTRRKRSTANPIRDANDSDRRGHEAPRCHATRASGTSTSEAARWSALAPSAQKELREHIDNVEARREVAELELVELIELAELPIEFMGSA
jgi:hypothetical protein